MELSGNSILITGGGSGIGRGLAEALHLRGNEVIIAGRRQGMLDEVVAANPGMRSILLDIADPASIGAAAKQIVFDFPKLNVLINNAGIQLPDRADAPIDDEVLVATITTNLMGPIRLTSVLIEHLKAQPRATIVHVSSMLAIMPIVPVAIYCAAKAAMHSYAMSQRYTLKGTSVDVVEILPTRIDTDLGRGKGDPRAMPLDAYVAETIEMLGTDAKEIYVAAARERIATLRPNEMGAVDQFNDMMLGR